jgi:hypothetical protein
MNYSFPRNSKSLVHVFGKNSQRNLGTVAYFRDKKVFSDRFFENFSENVELVVELLCLSRRQPEYQRVETNTYCFSVLFLFLFFISFLILKKHNEDRWGRGDSPPPLALPPVAPKGGCWGGGGEPPRRHATMDAHNVVN